MNIFRFSNLSGLIFCLFLPLLSCSATNFHTYESIKAEYSSPIKQIPFPGNKTANLANSTSSAVKKTLTLKKAIEQALQNNPKTEIARAKIMGSRAAMQKARSAFWPGISAYSQYTQADAPSAYLFKTIDQRKFAPDTDFNDPGWFENYETGIRTRINLFKGGRDILGLDMARQDMEIKALNKQAVDNELQSTVINAYYNSLAAEDYIQIAKQSLNTVRKELELTRVRYDAGGVLKSDLLSMRVRLARSEEELIRAQNNLQRNFAALANALGLNPDQKFSLIRPEPIHMDIPLKYSQKIDYALKHRPELEKVRQKLVKSRLHLDMVKAENLPRLDLEGKYYHDDPDLHYSSSRENWTLGLMLNWELFKGFGTRAKADKIQASIKEILAADSKTVQAIQLDVKNSVLLLKDAQARKKVTRARVKQAREAFNLVRLQYAGGSSTITRYLNAELALTKARLAATSAYYDQCKARSELGRALGYWSNH